MDQQGAKVIPFDGKPSNVVDFPPPRKKTLHEQILGQFIQDELPEVECLSIVYRQKDGTHGYVTDQGGRAGLFYFLDEAKVRFLLDNDRPETPPQPSAS